MQYGAEALRAGWSGVLLPCLESGASLVLTKCPCLQDGRELEKRWLWACLDKEAQHSLTVSCHPREAENKNGRPNQALWTESKMQQKKLG